MASGVCPLNSLWGTRWPLLQAPMAGVQDEALALAVSAAGGLGALPAATLDAQGLHDKLQRLHASGLPYNVNFFCHAQAPLSAEADARWRSALRPLQAQWGVDPNTPPSGGGRRPFDAGMAEVLEAFKPTVVSFHFGLPEPALLASVKARGAFVLSSATSLREALWLQAHGADGVIAQGLEAGGHRGHFLDTDVAQQLPTAELLSQVVAQLGVPVIAAGGISDANAVAQAMAAGAAGVQVGTAFLLCDEAKTSALHRARLRDVEAPTALTNVFSGGLARGLVNAAMQALGPVSPAAPPFPHAADAMGPLRAQAERQGSDAFTPLWSGTRREGCVAAPAATLVQDLARGFSPP
jgi:nitronate monooxygenase